MSVDPLPSIRVYRRIRTAHLERLALMRPAELVFNETRYDFERGAIDPNRRPRLLSRGGVVVMLARRSFRVVELGEPSIVNNWPDLVAQLVVIRVRDLITRRRTRIVTYCIGIADPAEEVEVRLHVGAKVARRLTTLILRATVPRFDRLAFGTAGSRAAYEAYVDAEVVADRSRLFEALPAPCECLTMAPPERQNRLLFIGAFIGRKGIEQLMHGWETVRVAGTTAQLALIGKGELTEQVLEWAADKSEVSVIVDPPREKIHELLRSSTTIALLSQRAGHWREQIGLPILEGLSHGCEVVATTETGLAPWLREHGHDVIAPDAAPDVTGAALVRALRRGARRRGTLDVLPQQDQRIAADHWMFE
jgi:glycosyltransferase involved in cell wall biosynthesis